MSIPYPQRHQARNPALPPYAQADRSLSEAQPIQPAQTKTPKLSREAAAKLALEHTIITAQTAWVTSLLFLLTIFSVPLIQYLAAGGHRLPVSYTGMATLQHIPTAGELKSFESNLEQDSIVASWILPHAQRALLQLGAGNEQVVVGREHWLMYRPDVEYLTGRGFLDPGHLQARSRAGGEATAPIHPNPLPAILRFKEQLAQRGITLIVMPIPLKPMLYPERLSSRYAPPYNLIQHALQNPSYAKFTQVLQSHGVLICDVSKSLLQAKLSTGQAQFLETDAHWTPAGMQVAAQELGHFIQEQVALPTVKPVDYQRQATTVASRGDIATMLKLPPQTQNFQAQAVMIQQVSIPQGGVWRPSHEADVLLLGDSFINIYSRPDLGWGQAAGLAEQLSYGLHRPLDVIAVNAGGASGARQRLREDLLQGNDRLKGKRVVVWEFAMRDLTGGNWQLLDLPSDSSPASVWNAAVKTTPVKLTLGTPAAVAKFRHAIATQAVQDEKTNANVYPGKDGWLFYLPDIYYLTMSGFLHGPQPPQIKALVDFKRQLARRGIKLLVMPVPPKTMIYPEKLGVNYNGLVPQNPAFACFRHALEAQGIICFDSTPTLLAAKGQTNTPVYIPTDTHWSFAGMASVAQQLAGVITRQGSLPKREPMAYLRQPVQVRNVTDISMMLKPVGAKKPYIYNNMTVQQVKMPDAKLWQPAHDADILVLGDSLTNIYSYGGYWGKAAGLAPQLSYYLQRPVDSIAIDGGGADLPREELQQKMLRGEDRLAGKKLVICEFACRYLIGHPWKIIHFPTPKTSAQHALSNPTATAVKPPMTLLSGVEVRGKIKARATVPPPNTMPYKDLVMAVQLTAVEITSGPQKGTRLNHDIIVYVWGMCDQTLTSAAAWNPGQSVATQLISWRDAEDQYGSYNRVGLASHETLRLDTYWGEAKPG